MPKHRKPLNCFVTEKKFADTLKFLGGIFMNYYVFRIAYDNFENFKIIRDEMLQGRLRQG